MGRVGAAGDYAAMESFFALLQKNVLNTRTWPTRLELRLAIVTWIEASYHRRRRQRALVRLTPIEYEMIMTTQAATAAQPDASPKPSAVPTNGGEWSQLLASDQDGDPVYVYRLQFIGHPGFGGVAIDSEVDVLPDGLEFVGFVAEADKATGAAAVPGPVDVEGNLTASFDPTAGPNGTITLAQQPGTAFPDGTTASVYFAARVTDDHEVIVNKFGISSTTIVPTEPSIDIEKWTEEGSDSGPTYDEYGALTNDGYPGDFDSAPGKTLTAGKDQQIHFTVSNDGPEPLRDIVVSDSLTSGSGTITDLVCTFPGSTEEEPLVGTEWAGPFEPGTQFECEGTLPALAPGQTHENTATVTAVGVLSGREVGDADMWNGKTAPATPAPSDPDEQLASTGGTIATGLIGVAALGIIAGITLLMIRRRGRHIV